MFIISCICVHYIRDSFSSKKILMYFFCVNLILLTATEELTTTDLSKIENAKNITQLPTFTLLSTVKK